MSIIHGFLRLVRFHYKDSHALVDKNLGYFYLAILHNFTMNFGGGFLFFLK